VLTAGESFTVQGDGANVVIDFPTWRSARQTAATVKPWLKRAIRSRQRDRAHLTTPALEIRLRGIPAIRYERGARTHPLMRLLWPDGLSVHSLPGAALLLAA
jgi:hypothetical protein